ncbi:MAG: hypothetical protein JWO20_2543 [Candidatus Angelobacter sp.]|nr:hypothetical protein [Candidatus Angelobacter sp.]
MSMMKDAMRGDISYVTPNPAALALNSALKAAAMAETLRSFLETTPSVAPSGEQGMQYRNDCLTSLYDFFEHSMISVTMSFQSLELFANAIIGRRAKGNVRAKHRKLERDFAPSEAERALSTEEKLSQVIPKLMNVRNPSGTSVWNALKDLQKARDSAVHLKSLDMYTNYESMDLQTLFFVFLNEDIRQYPGKALTVINHFYAQAQPRWLAAANEISQRDRVIGS